MKFEIKPTIGRIEIVIFVIVTLFFSNFSSSFFLIGVMAMICAIIIFLTDSPKSYLLIGLVWMFGGATSLVMYPRFIPFYAGTLFYTMSGLVILFGSITIFALIRGRIRHIKKNEHPISNSGINTHPSFSNGLIIVIACFILLLIGTLSGFIGENLDHLLAPNVTVNVVNESTSNQEVGQISPGLWYYSTTMEIAGETHYLMMEIIWYDSNGQVILDQLTWNQTNLAPGEYKINITYQLNTTPSKVKVLFYDNQSRVGIKNKAQLSEEMFPPCNGWKG